MVTVSVNLKKNIFFFSRKQRLEASTIVCLTSECSHTKWNTMKYNSMNHLKW